MIVKKEQLENLKEIYDKYRLFIYPSAISIACLILIVTVLFPQVRAFIGDRSTTKDINDRVKVLEVKADELSGIDGDDLSRKLNLATSALPTDKDYGSIIGLIQRIGAESAVTVSSLTLSPNTGEKLVGFSIKAEVLGTEQAVNQMIENIEKSPRVMKVSSIDVASSTVNDTVTGSLLIYALYVPAPVSLGSVDSELPKLSQKDEEILATLASSSLAQTVPTQPSTPSEPAGPLLPRGKANPFQ